MVLRALARVRSNERRDRVAERADGDAGVGATPAGIGDGGVTFGMFAVAIAFNETLSSIAAAHYFLLTLTIVASQKDM
jgi:hypothetical protein